MIWNLFWYLGITIGVLKFIRWALTKWRGTIDRSNEINVRGKLIVITGASSGIGRETALELATRNAIIILACRNVEKAKETIAYIRNKTSRGQLISMQLNLESLDSVRNFAKNFNQKYDRLDILINNAGVMMPTKEKTRDGFEVNFGVNHLGHFLLTNLLLQPLKKSAQSRVVTVSAVAHSWGSMDFEDIMMENKKVTSTFFVNKLYSNSKLANALFNKELGKRLGGTGVRTYALCPGVVFTDLGRHLDVPILHLFRPLFWYLLRSPEEGAWTTIYCALSKNLVHESGEMYRNCKHWDQKHRIKLSEVDATKLWNISERLVGLAK